MTTFFFFVFFLVIGLFYRSQMVNFKENYHYSRFQYFPGGSNFFQGGPTFSRGGRVQLLIPYRNPYNLGFFRGRGWGKTLSLQGTSPIPVLYIG